MTQPQISGKKLGLVLTGGGARAAYQIGVLRGIARNWPDLQFEILTGVSAGAINVSFLANHRDGNLADAVEQLRELWLSLQPEKVFRVDSPSLIRKILGFNLRMLLGGSKVAPEVRGAVDTAPLREFLNHALSTADGTLEGIELNIEEGRIKALALSTVEYSTGQTVTWVEGKGVPMWERTHRHSEPCEIVVDHVMASAALPIMFPAININGSYFGDGGIRLAAPLSPALHLGADRILAVPTRHRRAIGTRAEPATIGYPPPAQVAGVLVNAIFLDMLDQDVRRLRRINRLLETRKEADPMLKRIELVVLRPSKDLGRLAGEFDLKLPPAFRFIARGFGTSQTSSPDLLAMLMFQPDYIGRLIEVGEQDALDQKDKIEELLLDHDA